MALSDMLNYSSPYIENETRMNFNPAGVGSNRWQQQQRNVVKGPGQLDMSPLDDFLKGYDAESAALSGKLKSIYDGYQSNYKEYGETMKPIMDALTEDMGKFEEYIGDYEGLVSGMEGDFLDSILVDPSATRTKNEYLGNVASQYDTMQDTQRRQAIQQGENPYENKGGQRDIALSRAADMAGAANQAYGDWREDYNRDIAAQQQANAQYAGLFGKTGDMYGNLLSGRSALLQGNQGIYDAGLAADQARASGYEGLLGRQDNQKRDALQLAQQQAAMHAQAQSEANQMKGSLKGQSWYNPSFNAGGSERNS